MVLNGTKNKMNPITVTYGRNEALFRSFKVKISHVRRSQISAILYKYGSRKRTISVLFIYKVDIKLHDYFLDNN